MGPIGAQKAHTVIHNVSRILAIELIAACQGIDLLAPLKPSKTLQAIHAAVRVMCPFMSEDRSLSREIEDVAQWLRAGGLEQLLAEVKFDMPRKQLAEA